MNLSVLLRHVFCLGRTPSDSNIPPVQTNYMGLLPASSMAIVLA